MKRETYTLALECEFMAAVNHANPYAAAAQFTAENRATVEARARAAGWSLTPAAKLIRCPECKWKKVQP
jgi:hypothetical protein